MNLLDSLTRKFKGALTWCVSPLPSFWATHIYDWCPFIPDVIWSVGLSIIVAPDFASTQRIEGLGSPSAEHVTFSPISYAFLTLSSCNLVGLAKVKNKYHFQMFLSNAAVYHADLL